MPTTGRSGSGSHVQSVIFSKDNWEPERAKAWLKRNKYRSGNMDETSTSFRFRQVDPEESRFRYRNKSIGDGITLVTAFPLGSAQKWDFEITPERKDMTLYETNH